VVVRVKDRNALSPVRWLIGELRRETWFRSPWYWVFIVAELGVIVVMIAAQEHLHVAVWWT
jgi:hypothetical protein